jgi:hypothetical protein
MGTTEKQFIPERNQSLASLYGNVRQKLLCVVSYNRQSSLFQQIFPCTNIYAP